MRRIYLCGAALLAAFSIQFLSPVVAQSFDAPRIVYGLPPIPIPVPPAGYVLDPSDAIKPIYVVEHIPAYLPYGVLIARPTYSEGGFAISAPVHPADVHRQYGNGPQATYLYSPAANARVIKIESEEK